MKLTIVEHYQRDREAADTIPERRFVWRMYTKAAIDEFATVKRKREIEERLNTFLDEHAIAWRKALGDDELPVRYPPYWRAIPLAELQALWLALERAKHKAGDDE